MSGLGSVNPAIETDKSIIEPGASPPDPRHALSLRWFAPFSMTADGLPDDALGVEHGALDAGARVMRLAAVGSTRGDDAAVAAAEAAAHDLLQRHVAGTAVRGGERGAGAHHRRRAADEQLHGIAERPLAERGLERDGDAAGDAGAAVLGGQHDRDAQRVEQIDAVELFGAPRAV